MAKLSPAQKKLKSIKRQAHTISKQNDISKQEALEKAAVLNGYKNWQDCRSKVLDGKLNTPKPISKLDVPVQSADDLIGVVEENNILRANVRISYRSINDEFIWKHSGLPVEGFTPNVQLLRHSLEQEYQVICRESPEHLFIVLLFEISENCLALLENPESFFQSFISKRKRLFDIDLRIKDPKLNFFDFLNYFPEWQESYSRDVLDPLFMRVSDK